MHALQLVRVGSKLCHVVKSKAGKAWKLQDVGVGGSAVGSGSKALVRGGSAALQRSSNSSERFIRAEGTVQRAPVGRGNRGRGTFSLVLAKAVRVF